MELFLVRHAQSVNNSLPEEQRVEDPGITELGREQAKHLAEWIPVLRLTRLITSPFRRTLETTKWLRRTLDLTPEVRVEIHEQGGCYSGHTPENIVGRPGMTRAEIERHLPGCKIADEIDGAGWWRSRPYETLSEAQARARRILQLVLEEFADTDERVAFVMHADIKRLILNELDFTPPLAPCNTSVTTLVVRPHGVELRDFNRIEHLPERLITR